MKHYNEYKYVLINENVKKTVEDIIKIIEYNNLISKNKRLLQSKLNKIINPNNSSIVNSLTLLFKMIFSVFFILRFLYIFFLTFLKIILRNY